MPRGVTVKLATELGTGEGTLTENVHQVVVKTECNGPGEQVIHRKSERRRVARDIFLVFEEQPCRRQGRGNNRKRGPVKPKFGHLKVEGLSVNARGKAGLLRNIKNEPKCYVDTLEATNDIRPIDSKRKTPIRQSGSNINAKCNATNNNARAICKKSIQIKPSNNNNNNCNNKAAASVNPIFLWAKQDDTRIIEVRCEDYDKRNRIRITKTTTGWRAIPRSDASTSRIVKYFQTPSSLLKLKREAYDNKLLMQDIGAVTGTTFIPETSSETIDSGLALADQDQDTLHANSNTAIEIADSINDNQNEMQNTINLENIDDYSCEASFNIKENYLQTSQHQIDTSEQVAQVIESQNCAVQTIAKEIDKISIEPDTCGSCTPELQLCPRTGIFLRHNICKESDKLEMGANDSGIHIDITQCTLDTETVPSDDSVIGSFDTDATNLKDLLDDADLLQHCGDNINSNSELIDTLVKHSCEANLINQNELLNSTCLSTLGESSTPNVSSKDSIDEGIVDNILPPMEQRNEAPKCLSFNEAGEIEGVNEEIFQTSHNFNKNFENDALTENNSMMHHTKHQNIDVIQSINLPLRNTTSIVEGAMSTNIVDNVPKDLSYRKTETSETHSQCAVTSSSDILLSPHQDEVPVVESATETIKNFILEQFMNLNALNSLPNTAINKKPQQSEPIDLGQQQQHQQQQKLDEEITCELVKDTPDIIETVIIDDNSNDEPATKKLCSNLDKKIIPNVAALIPPPLTTATATTSIDIDDDPDPLTQLQLLLRNTQWKVPDPILVPKDRLGAVLASPAREIPLLITTRPELRLPEAFAYPHIIQNPNILVISMAQLEAILKNEMDKAQPEKDNIIEAFSTKSSAHLTPKPTPKDLNTKCSYVESNNSMPTDINAATLAVLNQMLWLPYFGQWSQDIIKTLKTPMQIPHQFQNFLTPYNHIPYGLQHLDELYKGYVKQMSNIKLQPNENDTTTFSSSPMYLRAMGAFHNHVDMMVLQKLLQQQIQNFPNTDKPSSSSLASSASLTRSLSEKIQDPTSNNNSLNNHQIHTIPQQQTEINSKNLACKIDYTNSSGSDIVKKPINSDNIELNINKLSVQSKNQILKTKPRLTCKSLSNLLEPGNQTPRSVPLINFTTENTSNTQFSNLSSISSCLQPNISNNMSAASICEQVNINPTDITAEKHRQHIPTNNSIQTQGTSNKNTNFSNMEENTSFNHPLFNSNISTGYNSQWNWTTVTAAGE